MHRMRLMELCAVTRFVCVGGGGGVKISGQKSKTDFHLTMEILFHQGVWLNGQPVFIDIYISVTDKDVDPSSTASEKKNMTLTMSLDK